MEADAEILATLLKHIPSCMDVLPGLLNVVCADDDGQPPGPGWLEYPYCKSHPIVRWLPSKLAEWIGENYGQQLQIPPKRNLEWTVGELNAILESNLVPATMAKGSCGHLAAFSGSVNSTVEGPRHAAIPSI